jgi:hypothetical protein
MDESKELALAGGSAKGKAYIPEPPLPRVANAARVATIAFLPERPGALEGKFGRRTAGRLSL